MAVAEQKATISTEQDVARERNPEEATFTEQDLALGQKSEEATDLETVGGTDACEISSFRKTIRSAGYLQTMELPATYVKQHGHNFTATVTLHGPSGHAVLVPLSIKSYPLQDRVYFFGPGWRQFVLHNHLQVGHELLFTLVSMSSFTVQFLLNIPNPNTRPKPASQTLKPPQKHRFRRALEPQQLQQQHQRPKLFLPEVRKEVDEKLFQEGVLGSGKDVSRNDVVYGHGTVGLKNEVESLLENVGCPHFVARIAKSNLRDHRSCTLSVPMEFQKKYGTYFSKFNFLHGPSGNTTEVWFSGTRHERFSKGWKAFHKANGIKLGDALLFSLRAPACWVVQKVGGAGTRPEHRSIGKEACDN